jgi:hypothetical protein
MRGVALHSARGDGQLRKLQVAWLTSKPHALGAGYDKINDIQRNTMQPGNLALSIKFLRKKKNNRHILPFLMKLGIGLLPQLHIARARMHVALISVEFIRQRFIFARRDCLPS